MKEYVIPEEVLNAIRAYLNSRPHGEVRQAMDVLSQLKVVEESTTETPTEEVQATE